MRASVYQPAKKTAQPDRGTGIFFGQVKIFVDIGINSPQYLLPELLPVAVMGSKMDSGTQN
jgi:hypothetical protein